MIGQELVRRELQQHKVALLADVDRTDAVGTVDSRGAVDGEGCDGLLRRQLHIDACQREQQRDGCGEGAARIEVRGQCHHTTGVDHLPTASECLPKREGRKRKQRGYYACVGHRADALVGGLQ